MAKKQNLRALPSMALHNGEWMKLESFTEEEQVSFWEQKMKNFGETYSEICTQRLREGKPLPGGLMPNGFEKL